MLIDTSIHSHGRGHCECDLCVDNCKCHYEGRCGDCQKIQSNDTFIVGRKGKAITVEDLQVC